MKIADKMKLFKKSLQIGDVETRELQKFAQTAFHSHK
jgi:hypothetical protein